MKKKSHIPWIGLHLNPRRQKSTQIHTYNISAHALMWPVSVSLLAQLTSAGSSGLVVKKRAGVGISRSTGTDFDRFRHVDLASLSLLRCTHHHDITSTRGCSWFNCMLRVSYNISHNIFIFSFVLGCFFFFVVYFNNDLSHIDDWFDVVVVVLVIGAAGAVISTVASQPKGPGSNSELPTPPTPMSPPSSFKYSGFLPPWVGLR